MTLSSGATAGTRVLVLGCGSSCGTPRIATEWGGGWGQCDPAEPRNFRRRSSLLVEREGFRVLVDTSPDLRLQLWDAAIREIDAILWTHDHADQTHGIDDLRPLVHRRGGLPLPGYADAGTAGSLRRRFSYVFHGNAGYPPLVSLDEIRPGELFSLGPFRIRPVSQDHGSISSLGYRFGDVAYSNDCVHLDETALDLLAGTRLWIVDCLRYHPHPSHAHLGRVLGWRERIRPERVILTNLHIDMDYRTLCESLPAGIAPAFDGMELWV